MSATARTLDAHSDETAVSFRAMTRASQSPGSARREVMPMNPLSRLILRRKNELGLTWIEIAARGGFPSHSTVHALATKKEHRTAPRRETQERLAKALDLPLDLIASTAAEAAGYTLQDIPTTLANGEDVRIVAAAMGEMSDADRAKLRMIAEAFVAEVRAEQRGQAQG